MEAKEKEEGKAEDEEAEEWEGWRRRKKTHRNMYFKKRQSQNERVTELNGIDTFRGNRKGRVK